MSDASREAGFEIIACPHPKYEKFDPVPADEAAEAIAELLRPWGGRLDPWDCRKPRNTSRTEARLRYWNERGREVDTVLVWLGHGVNDIGTRTAYLFVRGDPGTGGDSPKNARWFADRIDEHLRDRHSPDAWTIVVIEACGGARFVTEVDIELKQHDRGRRILVIGSGEPHATQFLGTLAADLEAVLNQVTEDVLPLSRLATLLKDITVGDEQRYSVGDHVLAGLQLRRVLPGPVTAVWNDYSQLRHALDGISADSDAFQALIHYASKGTGTDLGEFAWHFVGRARERREIFRWLRRVEQQPAQPSLLVVTGPAASGKSALLGSVLIDCHPDLADGLEKVIGKRRIERPGGSPLPAFDLILHLTGATVRGTAAQILSRLGLERELGGVDPVAEVYRRVAARQDPLLIMADALDESEEPAALAHFFDELLRFDRVHLIIGTRSSAGGTGSDLAVVLRSDDAVGRTSLVLESSPEDVIESLVGRLRDEDLRQLVRGSSGRPAADPGTAAAAGIPSHEFLWAAMAAEELNARSDELRQNPELVREILRTDHRGLFRLALTRLGADSELMRTALLALAMAHGRGLPRQDRIWEEAVSALSASREPVTVADLNDVLAAGGAYIMLDHEHGQGVYRLVHRALQEQLLEEEEDLELKQLYVFRQLLAHIRPEHELNPYLRVRLSTHAARALSVAAWEELGGRPDVLDRLDPYAVAADGLPTNNADTLPVAVLGTISTANLVRQGGDDDRPGLRTLGEAWVLGGTPQTGTAAPGAWSVRWSVLPQRPVYLPLGGSEDTRNGARAMVLVPRDGRSGVLAVAAGNAVVRIWDPVTGQPAGASFDMDRVHPARTHGRGVAALAVLKHQDKYLLAGAPMGGQVVLWDPFTGRPESAWIPAGPPVDGIAAYQGPDGSARLALARAGGRVQRIAPMAGLAEPAELDAGGPVSAISAVDLADGVVIIALAASGRLSAWNADTGRSWSKGVRLEHGGVGMSVLEAGDGEIVLAVLDDDHVCHRVRLRADADAAVGPAEPAPLVATETATRISTLRLTDGRDLLAATDDRGRVKVWDLARPEKPIAGWQAHRDPVDALIAGESADGSGWALATIGKGAGVARVWPMPALRVSAEPPGELQVFRTAALGPLAVLAGRHELKFVDVRGAQQPAKQSHPKKIVSLAAVHGPDPLVVTADAERLWGWRARDGSKAWDRPHPEPVLAVVGVPEPADFVVTLDVDGVLRRWSIADGAPASQTAQTGVVRTAAIACFQDEDDVVVAIGGDSVVHRWRCRPRGVPEWTRLADVDCGMRPRAVCAVSRAGHDDPSRLFAVTAERILCQAGVGGDSWSVEDRDRTGKGACAWRDGKGRIRLAVGTEHGRISVFDGADGRLIRTIPTGLGINSLTAMIDDGRCGLVVGAREGAVVIDLHETQGARNE